MTETTILDSKSARSTALPIVSPYSLALQDIFAGLENWELWLYLSWHDIKLNYRRSALGPLWITISMAVTIAAMGLLYGKLFKMDLAVYYPFLATGMLSWNLISTLLLEGMNIFVDAEGFIKQMKQPYSLYIFRTVSKIFIIFFHHVVILIPLTLIFNLKITFAMLFLPISLLILWLNAVSYGTILSMISSRFRDLKPIMTSIVQIVFFLTPVMWTPALIPEKYQYIINLNPFAHFMNTIRAPLLGEFPNVYSLEFVIGTTFIGLITAFIVFASYRSRIAYWL